MAHEAHVSPDEAREALANVEAVETKVASLNARLNAVGSLASGGWSGVIIAAPQSALFTAMEFPSGWWVLVPWFCFLGLGLFFLVRLQRELNPVTVKIQMGFWVHTIAGGVIGLAILASVRGFSEWPMGIVGMTLAFYFLLVSMCLPFLFRQGGAYGQLGALLLAGVMLIEARVDPIADRMSWFAALSCVQMLIGFTIAWRMHRR